MYWTKLYYYFDQNQAVTISGNTSGRNSHGNYCSIGSLNLSSPKSLQSQCLIFYMHDNIFDVYSIFF
jgi:hypothetical protein